MREYKEQLVVAPSWSYVLFKERVWTLRVMSSVCPTRDRWEQVDLSMHKMSVYFGVDVPGYMGVCNAHALL